MSKDDYYSFFAECKPYIKFNTFLKECGISSSAFSKFLKGKQFYYEISEDKLKRLYDDITEFCNKIA